MTEQRTKEPKRGSLDNYIARAAAQARDPLSIPPQDYSDLIGLTLKEASERTGWKIRVVRCDEQPLIVTQDFDPYRINVETQDDRISKVKGAG